MCIRDSHTYSVQTVSCNDEAPHVALHEWEIISQQIQLPNATTCVVDTLSEQLITEAQNARSIHECENVLRAFLVGDLVHVLEPFVLP